MTDRDGSAIGVGEESPAIVNAFRVLKERWYCIAAAVIVCVAAAAIHDITAQKQYEATSSLLFRDSPLGNAVFGTDVFGGSVDPARDAATNVALVKSLPVAGRVKRETGFAGSANDLLGSVSVQSEENTDLVSITATNTDATNAARVANAYAKAFVAYRQEVERGNVARGVQLLQQRLDKLPADATAQRTQLNDALEKLLALEAVQTANVEIADLAEVPSDPSSPKLKRDVVLAFLLGLVIGVALAFLFDFIDRRVKSVEEFERIYRLRALVGVPQRSFRTTLPRARSAEFEPFRILRSSIYFAGVERGIKTVLVTSAVPGEGKTTVAINLARAAALSGQRVILIEADLRRPSVAERFGLDRRAGGLTSALVGGVPVRTLLQAPDDDLGDLLMVLTSGPLPPNPSEMLQSERLHAVLDELTSRADLVVIDSPPLLPVADARILLDRPEVDAAVVVARAFHTKRDIARRARAVLDQRRLDPLGLAVTGLPGGQAYEYYGASELAELTDHDGSRPAGRSSSDVSVPADASRP